MYVYLESIKELFEVLIPGKDILSFYILSLSYDNGLQNPKY